MIKIHSGGVMTEEKLIEMAMGTRTSHTTGSIILLPPVPVFHKPTGKTLSVLSIGKKNEHKGYVSTEEMRWVRLEDIDALPSKAK